MTGSLRSVAEEVSGQRRSALEVASEALDRAASAASSRTRELNSSQLNSRFV